MNTRQFHTAGSLSRGQKTFADCKGLQILKNNIDKVKVQ